MGVRSSLLFKYFYSVLHFLIDLRGYVLNHLKVLNLFSMRGGRMVFIVPTFEPSDEKDDKVMTRMTNDRN